MTSQSVMLIGGPDSGKTNYVARLWPSFKKRRGTLRADALPENIQFVDAAVEHLMKGSFAPRSDRNLEDSRQDFSIQVRNNDGRGPLTDLLVPDISGELWLKAVKLSELPQDWMDALQRAEGAILFVRALSDQNVQPMDWVTARRLLMLHIEDMEGEDHQDQHPAVTNDAAGSTAHDEPREEASEGEPQGTSERAEDSEANRHEPQAPHNQLGDERSHPSDVPGERQSVGVTNNDGTEIPDLPTQVMLCELLRYLDLLLCNRHDGGKPRVAIVVAAWDLLDAELRASGPFAYLKEQFPLFAGRVSDDSRLDVRLFGLSIVGGDLKNDPEFRRTFFEKDIVDQGWVIIQDGDQVRQSPDVTLPIAWAVGD